ncbi:MAG: hypothetical protein Ct9H90mP20_5290 [Candidatus Neomarinimicrobiota bacterium]|nr:MAG: hypothetical protein Ct9H90mP20_5290 [Candidatus Neomarinimicrobiota bacterium]
MEKTKIYVFNKALVSIGRKPNTSMLNIESTSINVSDSGFIGVDVYQRTNVENIFAIGDIWVIQCLLIAQLIKEKWQQNLHVDFQQLLMLRNPKRYLY